jgi:hypothetical protein
MAPREKQSVKRDAAHASDTLSNTANAVAKSAAKALASADAAKPAGRAAAAKNAERERDEFKAALETAVARISELEAAQSHVANRITWMIDTLQTLKEDAG